MANSIDVSRQVEIQWRVLNGYVLENHEYDFLYKSFSNGDLRTLLSSLHHAFNQLFRSMNTRLRSNNGNGHYLADDSRALLRCIETAYGIRGSLAATSQAIAIDHYYDDLFAKCRSFLSESGGSDIPADMQSVQIYYNQAIFTEENSLIVNRGGEKFPYPLKECGGGSFAHVYRYHDDFYDKWFVLKRARKGIGDKALARFRREYETMKGLNSPYIVEVYKYFDDRNAYSMEYMDSTVWDYIAKQNTELGKITRAGIARQALRGFQYLHSKQMLHRDISPGNVLIKRYDDVHVVKLSDFGLVKLEGSTFTTTGTDFKGVFNDPNLRVIGFDQYKMEHETYAMTLLTYYILTGKTNYSNIHDDALRAFVRKGTQPDLSARYHSAWELDDALTRLMSAMQ